MSSPVTPPGATLAHRRPAEVGGVAGSVALIIGRAAGIDDADTIVAIGAVIGVVPAAITWLVGIIRSQQTKGGE